MNTKEKIPGNYFEALNHVLKTECIPALKILCRLQQKEKRVKKNIQINSRAVRRGYGDIPTLKRALLCLLCIRVYNIFNDNQGISLKDFGKKLSQEGIIKKMIETRHRWFAHINKQNNVFIVSAKEVCNSNLLKKFEDISKQLNDIYFKRNILGKI